MENKYPVIENAHPFYFPGNNIGVLISHVLDLMELVKIDLHTINMPTLIFSSDVDHVVSPDNSQIIYHTISSETKEMISLKNSYHVATLDNDKDIIADRCLAFIKEHAN